MLFRSKTYVAEVEGEVFPRVLKQLREGVTLEDGPVEVRRVKLLASPRRQGDPDRSIVELVIHEGRNRQVRRMTAHVGFPTLRLVRVSVGEIVLGALQPGESAQVP